MFLNLVPIFVCLSPAGTVALVSRFLRHLPILRAPNPFGSGETEKLRVPPVCLSFHLAEEYFGGLTYPALDSWGCFLLPKVSGSFLYPSHPPWMWALPQAVATWRALCPEKERALGKDQHSVSSRVSALLPCVLTGDFPHCSPGLGRGDGTQG